MEPSKSASDKWESFLETLAKDVTQSQKYDLSNVKDQLALVDRKIDKIAEVIKQSPTAYRNIEAILNDLRFFTSQTTLDSPPFGIMQELYQLHHSIIFSLNLPLRTIDQVSILLNSSKKIDAFTGEVLEAIPLDPEFTKPNPDLKIINSQLKKFHMLLWKNMCFDKDRLATQSVAEAALILMMKCERLFFTHKEMVNLENLNLITTMIGHLRVEIKAPVLIRFLALDYNEILWKQLLVSLSDYTHNELIDYFPLLDLINRDRWYLIGILKNNSQAAFSIQQFMNRLCCVYKALTWAPAHGKTIITLFDIILYFNQRLEAFNTLEMKEVCDDTVLIQFDNGPLYIRKYWIIVLAMHSPVIHRMIFGDMKESVEFATKNLMTLKDVSRKDFRLLLKHYFDCKSLAINETLRLSRIGEFLDFKHIREATKERIKNFLETLPKHTLGYYTDESFETIHDLGKSLSEANLMTALSTLIESLSLPLTHGEVLLDRILLEDKYEHSSKYFRQFSFRYSLLRTHFADLLGSVHKVEVVRFIRAMVSRFLTNEEKYVRLLRSMRDVILTKSPETGLELKEKTELGGFVLVDQTKMNVQFDLDLSDYPVKFKILEALRRLYIGKLTLKKGNLTAKEIKKVCLLFPGVVVLESG